MCGTVRSCQLGVPISRQNEPKPVIFQPQIDDGKIGRRHCEHHGDHHQRHQKSKQYVGSGKFYAGKHVRSRDGEHHRGKRDDQGYHDRVEHIRQRLKKRRTDVGKHGSFGKSPEFIAMEFLRGLQRKHKSHKQRQKRHDDHEKYVQHDQALYYYTIRTLSFTSLFKRLR